MNNLEYMKNGAYKYRCETDKLFKMPGGSFHYGGIIDESIKFIEKIQLLDKNVWDIFVKQFAGSYPDDENLSWKCEFWGKMMRGACFTYEYTQNGELYEVLAQSVRDLLKTRDSLGRIATYSTEKEFDGWDLWGRKYVLLGLQYFLDICADENFKSEIITAMRRHADYIMSKVGKPEDGKKNITDCTRNWLGVNSSSILEPYVRLYSITGAKEYLDYAAYIVDNGGISEGNIFELAYENKLKPFEYPVTKAYEVMSCFEGLLEYYRVTKEEKYKTAVVNFANAVLDTDVTIIGSAGCTHELFDNSAKNQTSTVGNHLMQETCVTVTWMKLAHQLLCLTGDSRFADAIEISAYNAMLGSVNTERSEMLMGMPFDSYIPLFMGTRSRTMGGYQPLGKAWGYGCCACIGSAGTALSGLASVMQSEDGICVNMYLPGVVDCKTPGGKAFKLKTDTDYPKGSKVGISVQGLDAEEKFAIAVRIPAWCKNPKMKVCGNECDVKKGTYSKTERVWKNGDKIELDLQMSMTVILPPFGGADENSEYLYALMRGPVVFARDARLGEKIDSEADFDYNDDFEVEAIESHGASFKADMEYKVKLKDGSYITVVDFKSAGKTMNTASAMTVWMPRKNFWSVDFDKKISLACRDFIFSEKNGKLYGSHEDDNAESFAFESCGDNAFYIRSSKGKYVTACFDGEIGRYKLKLSEKGEKYQSWTLKHIAVNRYRLINAELDLAVGYSDPEPHFKPEFVLFDLTKNERFGAISCQNEAVVAIKNTD